MKNLKVLFCLMFSLIMVVVMGGFTTATVEDLEEDNILEYYTYSATGHTYRKITDKEEQTILRENINKITDLVTVEPLAKEPITGGFLIKTADGRKLEYYTTNDYLYNDGRQKYILPRKSLEKLKQLSKKHRFEDGSIQWLAYMSLENIVSIKGYGFLAEDDFKSEKSWNIDTSTTEIINKIGTALQAIQADPTKTKVFDSPINPNVPYESSIKLTLAFQSGVSHIVKMYPNRLEIQSSDRDTIYVYALDETQFNTFWQTANETLSK